MKAKWMGIPEILRKIWLFSANMAKSSESFSKQPTQLIIELNSSLRHIIVTLDSIILDSVEKLKVKLICQLFLKKLYLSKSSSCAIFLVVFCRLVLFEFFSFFCRAIEWNKKIKHWSEDNQLASSFTRFLSKTLQAQTPIRAAKVGIWNVTSVIQPFPDIRSFQCQQLRWWL